ncbi:MAG TPA: hypothetical protein VGQ36_26825 [Thermoanaerobaculia bacterium]|jgi:hypothetical protein|nr:hypothetical protein [Thermoanaerobaculia bacterium]
MRIDVTFEFNDGGMSAFPAGPSAVLGLPPLTIDRGKRVPLVYTFEGVGDLEPIEDSSGDLHGGLWDAFYRAILTVGPDLLIVGRDVAIGFIANWLFSIATKGRAPRITINRKTVSIDITVIRAAIEETTMTLKQRFDKFCEQFPGAVAIDSLPKPPKKVQKGDYLFEKQTIVCEVKCLDVDMEDKLLAIMKADGIDPEKLPKGRHIIEDLYLALSKKAKGKNRYKKLIKELTTSVGDAIKDAANQIPDTKKHLKIPNADGLLVILNESVNIIGQPLVSERLGIAFKTKQKNSEGQPYHSAVTRILHIGETNAAPTATGDMRVNTVITNPHAKPNQDVDAFVKKLAKAWAEFNGHPFHEAGSEIYELMANSKLYIDVL